MPKTLIRTIDAGTEDNALRLKRKLHEMGFYVLSGAGNFLEIYAIKDNEFFEDKVTKITEKVIAKYGGTIVYTQWAPIMKRILSAVSIVATLVFTGCHHSNHVTDGADPANLNGVWHANVSLGGANQNVDLIVVQNAGAITGDSLFTMDGRNAPMTGTVTDNDVALTIDEGSTCTNKMHIDGTLQGATLQIHLTGLGNAVGACYPHSIDLTATMTH